MSISKAIGKAWRAYTASFGATLRFLAVEGCLTLICLAPLLSLTDAALAPAAWAALVLWVFLMLPARMNAAQAMRDAFRGGSLGGRALGSLAGYGGKLVFALKRVGFLLLWSAPLIALAILFRIHFAGEVDSFTVLRMVKNDLGGGDQLTGLLVVAAALVAALLILMFGCAFHSGARHAFAQGDPRLVRRRHGKVLGAWFASLLAILPMLIAVVCVVFRYLPAVSDLNGLLMGTSDLPDTRGTLLILGAGAVLTLPLLPLRSLIPAALVDGLKEGGRRRRR